MVGKTRIEALSDGLFAIVMTLLILEIKVPIGASQNQLAAELAKEAPSWITFAVTFLLASFFWVDQHRVLSALSKISSEALALNFLFLALVSVLPFSTSLWGHYLRNHLAISLYFGNQLAIVLALTAQFELAVYRKQMIQDADTWKTRFRLGTLCLVLIAATVSALLVNPSRVWVAPFLVGLIMRVARRRWKKTKTMAVSGSVAHMP
jgi:uncharacterized membrane protein